jgi:hypothetical protein
MIKYTSELKFHAQKKRFNMVLQLQRGEMLRFEFEKRLLRLTTILFVDWWRMASRLMMTVIPRNNPVHQILLR